MRLAALRATLLGSVAIASAMSAEATLAEDQNTRNVTLLDRLVIGAGAEKVAIDTPQAVTVLDQEAMDQLQAATTGELFDEVPGVNIVGAQRQLGEAFNIRGIGTTENSSDGSRIVVTVDGAPKFNEQYRMGSFFSDPELYKQVEVLRGPASSTLYGAGAIGGTINFTTKDASDFIKPGQTGAVKVKGGLDSNGLGTLTSGIWAHQINETFEVLATGNWRRSEDVTQANGMVLDGSAFDTWSGLLKGTFRFGDNDEQVLRTSYQRWFSTARDQSYAQTGSGGPGGLLVFGPPGTPPATLGSLFGIIDRDVLDQTAVFSWENPDSDNPWIDANVHLSFSDTTNKQFNHRDSNGVPTPQTGDSVLVDTTYAYKTLQLKADNTFEWITDDFENFLTVGLQASSQDREAVRPGTAQPLPAHPQGNEKKLGIFAQNEFIWDDRLTLIAGARGDFHNVTATSGGTPDRNGFAFSPKVAALYDFNDHFSIFGSLAHTERLPTIDEFYSIAAANPGRNLSGKTASLNLRKESANTIEAGFSVSGYDIARSGDSAAIKTTAFYNDITDLIVSNSHNAFGAAMPEYFGNVGRAQTYGLEIEGSYESDILFARFAYTYTVGNDLIAGTPLTTAPQNKVVFTLGGRHEEWDLEFGGRVTLADVGAYIEPTSNGADGPANASGTVDLFASWTPEYGPMEGTEVQFAVDNLFNADYRENLALNRSTGRTFKLSLAKQFDY